MIEEFGQVVEPGRLLVVDYVPPTPDGRTEGLIYLFDGGTLPREMAVRLRPRPGELAGLAWADELEAKELLSPLLARRLEAALQARASGRVAYLEDGVPIG